MKFIGKKIGMIEIFDKNNQLIPVTIIKLFPTAITSIIESNDSTKFFVQFGYNLKKKISLTKPELGHLVKKKLERYQFLRQFSTSKMDSFNFTIGNFIPIDFLKIGTPIKIQGKSIGKGNTGNIKKNSFNRGPMSHGSKHHRLQGSMGSGTTPGRVFPGKKMPGRSGGVNVTIANLQIIDLNQKKNFLFLKGSVPGKKGNILTIST